MLKYLRNRPTEADLGHCIVGMITPLPKGRPVEQWHADEIAVIEHPDHPRHLYQRLGTSDVIVSAELRDSLERLVNGQAEFLPIRLQSADGQIEFSGYSILHPFDLLTVADESTDRPRILSSKRGVVVSQPVSEMLGRAFSQDVLLEPL